ncbi:hypothetical protein [Sphingomonas koreensis]|uniref:hypothetical protein n=1 Tax=Sphingomonas koreensis TaxID=93064 RepID=UPI0013DF4773|nr:hypothetical protein [Sphingomonas koreensis]
MPSARYLRRTSYVAIVSAVAMASHAATPAAAMTTINCRGIAMKNACKQQEFCIDDPQGLSKGLILTLSLKSRIYITGSISGKITSIDPIQGKGFGLAIDPAIEGGTRIELSSDGKAAKLVGGDFNYFFRCRTARR